MFIARMITNRNSLETKPEDKRTPKNIGVEGKLIFSMVFH
jgi:hypothetical protein